VGVYNCWASIQFVGVYNCYSGSYPKDSPELVSVSIPTPVYLQVYTHPFASWFVAAFGMLLLFFTGEARGKKTNK
jgi:hypothetical protein